MTKRKTNAERLEDIDKRLAQLNEQKKAIKSRERQKERSNRTHRLIQIGALSEKYFSCANIEPTDYESLLKILIQLPQLKDAISAFDNHTTTIRYNPQSEDMNV